MRRPEHLPIAQAAESGLVQPGEAERVVQESDDPARGEHRGARPHQADQETAPSGSAGERQRYGEPGREHADDRDCEHPPGEAGRGVGEPGLLITEPEVAAKRPIAVPDDEHRRPGEGVQGSPPRTPV
jgi:hypothetical protein